MEKLKKRLKAKGWGKKDIDKAIKIIKHAKVNKHTKIKFLDKIVYWIALIIAIIGNFLISIALIPFLLVLKSFQLFLVVIVLGISFGLFFEILIRSIEHLTHKHHFYLIVIIPTIAVLNVFIITTFSEVIGVIGFAIKNEHNPFIVGLTYGVAFIAPFIFYKGVLKKGYYLDAKL